MNSSRTALTAPAAADGPVNVFLMVSDGQGFHAVGATTLYRGAPPVYQDFPGWSRPTRGVTSYLDLPPETKSYLKALEHLTGAPVGIVSVGPRREETMEVPGGIRRARG